MPGLIFCVAHVSLRRSLRMDFCTPERNLCVNSGVVKNRESESSKPILWGCECNAMVAFALRKISREIENRPAQSDEREFLRKPG